MNKLHHGILEGELGIVEKSGIFFNTPSAFAQQNLFYPLWGATYTCIPPYRVERTQGFDAFLLFYIMQGTLHFQYQNTQFAACANTVVLLDCNCYNLYYVDALTKFHWFHFNGNCSNAYCTRLLNENGPTFPNQLSLEHYFTAILHALSTGSENEDLLSVRIHQIFSLLATPPNQKKSYSIPIAKAKDLIDTHFHETISIETLASTAMLSNYYFARQFHTETGYSPHAYLIKVRIDHAKQRLAETTDTIEKIAEDCAFSSASNFIRTFRQQTGMTPYKFRKLF